MGMRADRVMQESNKVRKLFYDKEYPCRVRECQYPRHISENKSNDAVLDSVLSEKGIKLIIAPPGSGKSTAILARANELVANNKDYKVILDLPTRALALQMGNDGTVRTMVGGDSFDEKSPITATTYEKMYEAEKYIMGQMMQGTAEKTVLVLDESHLLTTQHTFREDAIKAVIRCIEKNYFHSIVLVTATPDPMSLFHADEIVEFESINNKPTISRLEIIEVDDPIEYIKNIDYRSEFPFIRLNKIDEINNLMAQMPQTFARLTGKDRQTKTYLDIVEQGKIDSTGIKGILTTSVIEAGVSITDYPENIVPMAVFLDNNISTDDIEQFLNRIRSKGNKQIKCARVIVRKPNQRDIKVSLFPNIDGGTCICEFHDIHMEMGNLTINDTGLLDTVADGKYRLHFEIGENFFYRYITIASNGTTCEKRYSKSDTSPIRFDGIGFREFFNILETNYKKKEELETAREGLAEFYERKRQAMNLSGAKLDAERHRNNELIRMMVSGYFKESGEIGECFSYENNKVEVDKRICYEKSYSQFQRQYYHNHDILAKEMEFRLGTDVVLLEQDTQKGKKAVRSKVDLWENIEDLRQEMESNKSSLFWNYLMGYNATFLHHYSKKETVVRLREQEHIMGLLRMLEKAGIKGETAIGIMSASKNMKKINEYMKAFHTIMYNSFLEQCGGADISEMPCYKGKKRESMVQSAIYCYLAGKGQTSYKMTDGLINKIIEFYKKSYPADTKPPTADSVINIMKKMYKAKDKEYIRHDLRTDESDIFRLVTSDYK